MSWVEGSALGGTVGRGQKYALIVVAVSRRGAIDVPGAVNGCMLLITRQVQPDRNHRIGTGLEPVPTV
jgi:hypothetical protein